MADWVTGKVTKVQNWTDALFSLTVHAPVLPFTAGQFTKLGLEIEGERVQRAYSYVNSPDNPDLEFYLVTVPDGKLSPRLAALKPGDEVQVVSEAAGFFVLDEVPDCETLWMLATGTAIGPYLSILQLGKDLERFKNMVLVHAARYAADLSYLPLMQELEKSGYECKKETVGIYYVSGVMFPVQIIASSELDVDMHVQLKALTNHLEESLMRQYLLQASTFEGREKNLADIVLQVIVNSNMEKVREWKGSERIMCEALRVLMADELNEERVEGRIEGQREGKIRAYASLVQDGIITVEIGAEKAGMSVDDFTKEMKKAGYIIPAV